MRFADLKVMYCGLYDYSTLRPGDLILGGQSSDEPELEGVSMVISNNVRTKIGDFRELTILRIWPVGGIAKITWWHSARSFRAVLVLNPGGEDISEAMDQAPRRPQP